MTLTCHGLVKDFKSFAWEYSSGQNKHFVCSETELNLILFLVKRQGEQKPLLFLFLQVVNMCCSATRQRACK